jgi:GT2 family glycosyltransferase
VRLFTVTLAYAPAATLRAGIERFYETRDTDDWHLVIDQHYPSQSGEPASMAIAELRQQYGFAYLDPGKNLGYHGGFNAGMEFFRDIMKDRDALVCYDPDSWPEEHGWDRAIRNAMETFPELGTCGIMGPIGHREIRERGYTVAGSIGNRVIWRSQEAIIASLQAWRVGFIRQSGGFQEPNPYYGGIEAAMWAHLKQQGLDWGVLPYFNDSDRLRKQKDPRYREWQWAHAHLKTFQGDFAEFLTSGMRVENIGEF